jgi:hypothetical protein
VKALKTISIKKTASEIFTLSNLKPGEIFGNWLTISIANAPFPG